MESYIVKKANEDFDFLSQPLSQGSREKRWCKDKEGNGIHFKYQRANSSEACSEKISYEIAKVLGYKCAKIEFAYDEYGRLGILNYIFSTEKFPHYDIVAFLGDDARTNRKEYYIISIVKSCLDQKDSKLFNGFIKILFFDALIGETDRHENNWGLTVLENNTYEISPLYDNGCNLLSALKCNEEKLNLFNSNETEFLKYINNAKSCIRIEKNRKIKHFDLIRKLKEENLDILKCEVENLKKLTDEKIEEIVDRLPNEEEFITKMHKDLIKNCIKKRRDILIEIIEEEN